MNADLLFEILKPRPEWSAIAGSCENLDQWKWLLARADDHGLRPLLYTRLLHGRPDIVPPGILSQARAVFHATVARNLQLAAELADIVSWLESARIPVVPFKGPSLAALAYDNLGSRQCADLDVLVPRSQIHLAVKVLLSHGYRADCADEATSLPGNNEIVLSRSGRTDIDLHWAISPVYFPTFDEDGVWRRLQQVRLAGHVLPSLSSEDLFVCLAVHAARHCWASLRWICDISYLLGRRTLDWDAVLRQAVQFGCRRVTLLAIVLAAGIAEGGIPADLLALAKADRVVMALGSQVRTQLAERVSDIAGTPTGAAMQLRMVDGMRGRLRYIWKRSLLPNQTDSKAMRYLSTFRPLAYLARPVRIAAKVLRHH